MGLEIQVQQDIQYRQYRQQMKELLIHNNHLKMR